MKTIINSILDNDLYKFSMCYAVLQKFPNLKVKYTFTDRNNEIYPEGFANKLYEHIKMMESISLTKNEEIFLRKISYFPSWFIDFIKGYKFNSDEVLIKQDSIGHLSVMIEGFWYHTILWEVPLLALISELFYIETEQNLSIITSDIKHNIDGNKVINLVKHNAYFSDFGTRRRFSYNNQLDTINSMYNAQCFAGTSNLDIARIFNVKPIGTMAHEWIMAHGALYGYKQANKLALENWVDVYGGNLGIALADTYTTDTFLQSFDMKLAKLFDGVRQDSGDPYEFADKIINHYKLLGIDPMTKTIVFSDSLNVESAIAIKEYCVGKIKSSFGIGTNFTNDVGVKPMNIVIKLSYVLFNNQWQPAVKLSDSPGKHMGEINEINLCKQTLNINKNV